MILGYYSGQVYPFKRENITLRAAYRVNAVVPCEGVDKYFRDHRYDLIISLSVLFDYCHSVYLLPESGTIEYCFLVASKVEPPAGRNRRY